GAEGSSFLQAVSLDAGSVTNAAALESTFQPFIYGRGRSILAVPNLFSDQVLRYDVGDGGALTVGGQLTLPGGSLSTDALWVSESRALVNAITTGIVTEFDPRTMTVTRTVDFTTLGIARNPDNPADTNPEPSTMVIRDGKLYVALQQQFAPFASTSGTDVAVLDAETLAFERVIRDDRSAGAGRGGAAESMFVDEQGDLYVYAVASFGFVPGQEGGFLRIRAGEMAFDPDYFLAVTSAQIDVPGGLTGPLAGQFVYRDGFVYTVSQTPGALSNPPNFASDLAFQPVRINLAAQTVEKLPLPPGTSASSGVVERDGLILFGLGTATATGVYSYDPATGQASDGPILATEGAPQAFVALP
ncbi:MAG: hypothetical protein AAF809_03375, partial [Bacteroidota bacterium]